MQYLSENVVISQMGKIPHIITIIQENEIFFNIFYEKNLERSANLFIVEIAFSENMLYNNIKCV